MRPITFVFNNIRKLLNAELNNKHPYVQYTLKEDGTSTPEVGN
jgi:hypothetical protein